MCSHCTVDLTIDGAVKVDSEFMSPISPDQSASVTDPFQPVRESEDGDDESRGFNFELEGCGSTDDNADPYTPRDEPSILSNLRTATRQKLREAPPTRKE